MCSQSLDQGQGLHRYSMPIFKRHIIVDMVTRLPYFLQNENILFQNESHPIAFPISNPYNNYRTCNYNSIHGVDAVVTINQHNRRQGHAY